MKKIIENVKSSMWIFLMGICTLLSFSGCNEDDIPFIKLDEEVLVLTTDIQKKAVDVKANVPWKAISDAAWCRVLQGSGSYKGGFEIVVEPNNKPEARRATITVTGGSCSTTLIVEQPAADLALSVSEDEISFGMEASQHTLLVISNNYWCAHSSAEWCHVREVSNGENQELVINVDENTIGRTRQATVSVVSETDGKQVIKNIKVVQYTSEYVLELVSEKYNVDKKAQEMIVPLIISGKPYTLDVATDSEWLSAEVTDNKEIKLNVTENRTGEERVANITVTMSGFPGQPIIRKLAIIQSAHINELNVAVEEINLEPEGGKMDISYSANGPIEVECSSSWFKAVVVSAENKDVISVEYEPNYTLDVREGYVTAILKTENSKEVRRTIKLVQEPTEGFKLNVLSEKYNVDRSKQDLTIPLLISGSSYTLNVVSDSPWIGVSKSKDNTKIVADISENITGEERSAVITITMSDIPGDPIVRTVQIIQSAKVNDLSIPMDEVELNPKGGEILIPFKATDVPTLQCSENWFKAEIANGSDMIKVTYDPNYTESPREGYLTAKIKNGEGKEVIVSVKLVQTPTTGYKLEIASNKYDVVQKGLTLEIPLILEGDTFNLSASSSAEWAKPTVNKAEKKLTVIVGLNDTGKEREASITVTMFDKPGEPIVRKVQIVQSALINELDIPVDNVELNPEGGALTIPFKASETPTLQCSESWFKAEIAADSIKVAYEPNKTEYAREGYLTAKIKNGAGKEVSATVKLTQQPLGGYKLEVATDSYIAPKEGENLEIPLILAGKDFSLKASSNAEWAKPTVNEADKKLTVIVDLNDTGKEREAEISVTMYDKPGDPIVRKVRITQEAVVNELSVAVSEASIVPAGGEVTIAYTSNSPVKLTSSDNGSGKWLNATIDEVKKVINASADANHTGAVREAYLTLSSANKNGKEVSRTIKITQNFENINMLEVKSDKFNVGSEEKTLMIPLIVSGEGNTIEAVSDSPWLVVGDVTTNAVNLTVKKNDTGVERVGQITITMSGFPGQPIVRKVQVIQGAFVNEIEIPIQEVNFNANGETVQIPYKANGVITLQSSHEWFKVNLKTDIIEITADPNNSQSPREGYVTATLTNENGKTVQKSIKLTQNNIVKTDDGSVFSLDKTELTLKKGGTFSTPSGTVSLISDTDWTATTEAGWIKITPPSGVGKAEKQIITISAEVNGTKKGRSATITFKRTLSDEKNWITLKVDQEG